MQHDEEDPQREREATTLERVPTRLGCRLAHTSRKEVRSEPKVRAFPAGLLYCIYCILKKQLFNTNYKIQ